MEGCITGVGRSQRTQLKKTLCHCCTKEKGTQPMMPPFPSSPPLTQRSHSTQQRPFEGSKQQAGSIHKPCSPLKTNHRAKRDWVVASAGPSVMPFQKARRRQPAWAYPSPLPLYPRDTHCNEITAPTELFRATLSVSIIINMQISPSSKLPHLQQPSPSGICHWLLCA